MRITLSIVIFLFLLPTPCLSQTIIKGKVTDSITGLPISNATLSLYRGGMLQAKTQTNKLGNYQIHGLDPGTYKIQLQKIGYETITVKKKVLLANRTTVLNLKLTVTFTNFEIIGIDKANLFCSHWPILQKFTSLNIEEL